MSANHLRITAEMQCAIFFQILLYNGCIIEGAKNRSRQRQNPFYVVIPDGEAVTGVVMADQLRSLDYRARRTQEIGECSQDLLQEILSRIEPIMY